MGVDHEDGDVEAVMRTISAVRFGGPEVLEPVEAAEPVPGHGQVTVQVAAAGVLWLDTQIRQGKGPAQFPVTPPYVPGISVAGRVHAVGAGVREGLLGRRVIVQSITGGYAERTLADADSLIPVPEALDDSSALALLDDGSTALALLERTPVFAGERVLVLPAMGGLGSLLVQLARARGATVLAAARGARKLELAAALGAQVTVDYGEPDWPDRVRVASGGAGVDAVFDGVGGPVGETALGLLAACGRFSGYGGASGAPTALPEQDRQVRAVGMEQLREFAEGRGARVEYLLAEAAAGRIVPAVGQTYPLERAAEAHADIEARRSAGKSLLLLNV